jgi:LacI family transcriptional regulator
MQREHGSAAAAEGTQERVIGPRGRPTIAMVAKQAGVAASTVSRVLNGGYASDEVRERVERAVSALGYSPSANARSLKLGRTGSIGVVVETSQGPWFTQLLGGIEEELSEVHTGVQLSSLALRGHYDARQVASWIEEQRVDGLIFARAGRREAVLVEAAARANLPMSFISPDDDFGVGHVFRARNRSAGYEVAEHLVALGHRRIAFAGGPRDSFDTQERLAGVHDRLRGAGLDTNSVWFAQTYDAAAIAPYAERFLELGREAATAVVCGNDALAFGFMRAVQRKGLRVPSVVSVMGFDDANAALSWPGLSTASQPIKRMGQAACRSLLEQIELPSLRGYRLNEYAMELVVRESTSRLELNAP